MGLRRALSRVRAAPAFRSDRLRPCPPIFPRAVRFGAPLRCPNRLFRTTVAMRGGASVNKGKREAFQALHAQLFEDGPLLDDSEEPGPLRTDVRTLQKIRGDIATGKTLTSAEYGVVFHHLWHNEGVSIVERRRKVRQLREYVHLLGVPLDYTIAEVIMMAAESGLEAELALRELQNLGLPPRPRHFLRVILAYGRMDESRQLPLTNMWLSMCRIFHDMESSGHQPDETICKAVLDHALLGASNHLGGLGLRLAERSHGAGPVPGEYRRRAQRKRDFDLSHAGELGVQLARVVEHMAETRTDGQPMRIPVWADGALVELLCSAVYQGLESQALVGGSEPVSRARVDHARARLLQPLQALAATLERMTVPHTDGGRGGSYDEVYLWASQCGDVADVCQGVFELVDSQQGAGQMEELAAEAKGLVTNILVHLQTLLPLAILDHDAHELRNARARAMQEASAESSVADARGRPRGAAPTAPGHGPTFLEQKLKQLETPCDLDVFLRLMDVEVAEAEAALDSVRSQKTPESSGDEQEDAAAAMASLFMGSEDSERSPFRQDPPWDESDRPTQVWASCYQKTAACVRNSQAIRLTAGQSGHASRRELLERAVRVLSLHADSTMGLIKIGEHGALDDTVSASTAAVDVARAFLAHGETDEVPAERPQWGARQRKDIVKCIVSGSVDIEEACRNLRRVCRVLREGRWHREVDSICRVAANGLGQWIELDQDLVELVKIGSKASVEQDGGSIPLKDVGGDEGFQPREDAEAPPPEGGILMNSRFHSWSEGGSHDESLLGEHIVTVLDILELDKRYLEPKDRSIIHRRDIIDMLLARNSDDVWNEGLQIALKARKLLSSSKNLSRQNRRPSVPRQDQRHNPQVEEEGDEHSTKMWEIS
eukprot:scaffold772_cov236-Pinguiococcus_pyrenoidosus.AAC.3